MTKSDFGVFAEAKGSHVVFNPTAIIITSNIDPTLWYQGAHPNHREALFRRFDEYGIVRHMSVRIKQEPGSVPRVDCDLTD